MSKPLTDSKLYVWRNDVWLYHRRAGWRSIGRGSHLGGLSDELPDGAVEYNAETADEYMQISTCPNCALSSLTMCGLCHGLGLRLGKLVGEHLIRRGDNGTFVAIVYGEQRGSLSNEFADALGLPVEVLCELLRAIGFDVKGVLKDVESD